MGFRLLILGGLLLAMPLDGQTPAKKSPSLRTRAERLLKFCNTWEIDKLTQVVKDLVSPDVLGSVEPEIIADHMIRHCLDHGGFEIRKVKTSPQNLVATLQGKTSHLELELNLNEDEKGKLMMPALDPQPLQGWDMPRDLTDAGVMQAVQAEARQFAANGLFSGIIVIARGSTILVSQAEGYANREKKTPILASSPFTLASLSKIFTAVAVAQNVELKKLSFDDKIGGFFPAYPNRLIREQATVGMLLSHVAGMGDILDKRPASMMAKGWTKAAEFVPLTAMDDLEFTPGSNQGYSNAGLALAGAIAEKVSGIDFPDYLRQHIFAASGMVNSDPNNIPFKGPQLVTPYTRHGTDLKPNHWKVAAADLGSPAGGAISTAEDLVKFAEALRSGKLVSKSMLDQMKKPRFDRGEPSGYGYGMSTETINGQEWIGHNGGFQGVSTEISLMPNGPYTVVILENRDPPASEWLGTRIRALLSTKAKLGL